MNNNQFGRSMVEMLGVLAIIGVLSVGAIAGYSKAMFKYKLNKQAQQLTQVFNAVVRHVHSFNVPTMNLTEYFIQLNEVPKEMIKANTKNSITDVFNMTMDIIKETYSDYSIISIYMFPDFTKKSIENLQICRNMVFTIKEFADSVKNVATITDAGKENDHREIFMGDKYCKTNCIRDITNDQIYNLCTSHIGKKDFIFYLDWLDWSTK